MHLTADAWPDHLTCYKDDKSLVKRSPNSHADLIGIIALCQWLEPLHAHGDPQFSLELSPQLFEFWGVI